MHFFDDKVGYANAPLRPVAVHFLPSTHKFGGNVSGVLRTYICSSQSNRIKICDQISHFSTVCVLSRPVTKITSHEYTTASQWAEHRYSVRSASTGRTTQHSLQNQSTVNISRQINGTAKNSCFWNRPHPIMQFITLHVHWSVLIVEQSFVWQALQFPKMSAVNRLVGKA